MLLLISIDNSIFDLQLSEPMNFSGYREIEIDNSRIGAFTSIESTEYLSKRFMMKKYLGLTDVELKENEKMWFEEQGNLGIDSASGSNLRNVGISTGDIGSDLDSIDDLESNEAELDLDAENPDIGAESDTGDDLPGAL